MKTTTLIAAILTATAGLAWADAAEQARRDFNEMFGLRVKQARASTASADNLAVAKEILDAARQASVSPELMALLCDTAYELAVADARGLDMAVEALDILAKAVPGKAGAREERRIEVQLKRYAAAPAAQKTQVGERCLESLLEAAEGQKTSEGTVANLKAAERIAAQIGSGSLGTVRAKLQEQEARLEAAKKVAAAQKALKANPQDRAARELLIQLNLVELDEPAEAGKYLQADSEELLRTYIPLAAGEVEKVPADTCLELAGWYESLGAKASKAGTLNVLRRARTYLERFLAGHETKDARRLKAELQLKKVEEAIAKLEPKGGTEWVNILRLVDVRKHARAGTWAWDGGILGIAKRGPYSRTAVPVSPDGGYELKASFARIDGGGSTRILLPVGSTSCTLVLGLGREQICGLDRVSGDDVEKNGTKTPAASLAGPGRHTVHVKVTVKDEKAKVVVTLDDKELFTWTGAPANLSKAAEWSLTESSILGLGSNDARVAFHSMQLRMLSGKAKPVNVDELAARRADDQGKTIRDIPGRTTGWPRGGRTGGGRVGRP